MHRTKAFLDCSKLLSSINQPVEHASIYGNLRDNNQLNIGSFRQQLSMYNLY